MKNFQINAKLMEKSSANIMHDMPIHRGYEISENFMENQKSIIYEQSENKLYSSKAILLDLIGQ